MDFRISRVSCVEFHRQIDSSPTRFPLSAAFSAFLSARLCAALANMYKHDLATKHMSAGEKEFYFSDLAYMKDQKKMWRAEAAQRRADKETEKAERAAEKVEYKAMQAEIKAEEAAAKAAKKAKTASKQSQIMREMKVMPTMKAMKVKEMKATPTMKAMKS